MDVSPHSASEAVWICRREVVDAGVVIPAAVSTPTLLVEGGRQTEIAILVGSKAPCAECLGLV